MRVKIPVTIKAYGVVYVNAPRGTSAADLKRIAENRASEVLDRALLSKRTLRTLETNIWTIRASRPR